MESSLVKVPYKDLCKELARVFPASKETSVDGFEFATHKRGEVEIDWELVVYPPFCVECLPLLR